MDSKAFTRSRRRALHGIAALAAAVGATTLALPVAAQQAGMPQPDEKIEDTLKRLFGGRPLQPAGERIKLDAPMIAENGAVVPIRVDADLPMGADNFVRNIYIITDKNRRPLNAKFTLTPDAGRASVATNVRLAASSDIRAIAETSTGALYEIKREVKVTVGGCGG